MAGKLLHITNGDSFTEKLKDLSFPGDILTWREMLCEGPTPNTVFSDDFIATRCQFLINFSSSKTLVSDYKTMVFHFSTLNFETYDSATLWFEYDLFCHVNLAAAIYFFTKKHPELPLFLVCSGIVENDTKLYTLNELTDRQLLEEAQKRQLLDPASIDTFVNFWEIYTSNSHSELLTLAINTKKLPYLRACIHAHFSRFPDESSGLNALEFKVLNAIDEHSFLSQKQLLAYLLNNQEYYGFGDLQWINIIKKLQPFFTELLHLSLTDNGKKNLNNSSSVFKSLKDETQFGGVRKYQYFYDKSNNQLSRVHEN